jgi:sortase A
LPQFFDPEDYKKIFSTLPEIEEGDEVLVNIAGVEYLFLVETKKVVAPDDVSVLTPPTAGKYLTLMTCVPPGTSLKRLIVVCKLAVKSG